MLFDCFLRIWPGSLRSFSEVVMLPFAPCLRFQLRQAARRSFSETGRLPTLRHPQADILIGNDTEFF
jgi:hypothetical protein